MTQQTGCPELRESKVLLAVSIDGLSLRAFGDWGRNLVLYLARQRSGLTLRQIGEQVGPSRSGAAATDYKTVSKAIHYFEQRLVKDASLRKLTASLLSQLSIIET